MKTLTELSIEHGTDKGPFFHNYMPMYEHWIANRPVKKLLEVGLLRGQSARMWRDYFTGAEIIMMDNMSQPCPDFDFSGMRIVVGDSTKDLSWDSIPNDLDVIVDDGSHKPLDQISTFLLGFPHLVPGGLYFIEDTYFNFNTAYSGSTNDVLYPWLMQKIVAQTSSVESRASLTWPESEIYAYHFYQKVVVFEKKL